MIIIFLLLQHITACIWIFIGKYDYTTKDTWIYKTHSLDDEPFILYMSSIYFTVTTVLTVGYGDITPYNPVEKLFCIILMISGVLLFSFATGSLTSMISSSDQHDAVLNEKLNMLNYLSLEYHLEAELYNKISRTV